MIFLLDTEEELQEELEEYDAPPEAVEAKLEVKRCVDLMIYGDRYFVVLSLVCSYFFALSEGHKRS